jgi:hypothetical protein
MDRACAERVALESRTTPALALRERYLLAARRTRVPGLDRRASDAIAAKISSGLLRPSDPIGFTIGGGLTVTTDALDAIAALLYKWGTRKGANGMFYVARATRLPTPTGMRKTTLYLHRFLSGCAHGDGLIVDHRDGNPLNNRRKNLRITDEFGNGRNRRTQRQRFALKGVRPCGKRWRATIAAGPLKPNNRHAAVDLGYFDNPIDAAKAYDAAARAAFGEFASTNFAAEGAT